MFHFRLVLHIFVVINIVTVGAAIRDLHPTSEEEYIGMASTLALLVGINFLLMSFLKLGFLINFLSRPVLRYPIRKLNLVLRQLLVGSQVLQLLLL